LEPAFEAAYVGTLMGLVKAGLGVAIVPGYATALADPAFVSWSRLERPVIEREVFRVHRSGPLLSPSVQAFHSFVLEQLGLELAGVAAEVGNPNTRSKVHVKVKV
jgi:DNA-binding transcriptional LysR family regulator